MKETNLTFSSQFRNDAHNWHINETSNITHSSNLASVKDALEQKGSIVIEHWIYLGCQAPRRHVLDDFEEFIEYLTVNASAGDIIDIWSLHELISPKNRLVSGKCPDYDGCIPEGGVY